MEEKVNGFAGRFSSCHVDKVLYVEAYPRLVATDALSGWQHGKPSCSWRDEAGQVAGHGHVMWSSPRSFSFAFELAERAHVSAGQNHVELDARYRVFRRSSRVMLVCPKCRASKSILLIIERNMTCATCAGLRNRSAVMPAKLRALEKLYYINAIVAHGRPRSMRQSIYHNLMESRHKILSIYPGIARTSFRPLPEYERAEWHAKLLLSF